MVKMHYYEDLHFIMFVHNYKIILIFENLKKRLISKLDYIFYYFHNYEIDFCKLKTPLMTDEKKKNMINNIAKDNFIINLSRAMNLVEQLPKENATIRDFYELLFEYEEQQYNLNYIHPIHKTDGNKRPEYIKITNYAEFLAYDNDKLNLQLAKDGKDYKIHLQ